MKLGYGIGVGLVFLKNVKKTCPKLNGQEKLGPPENVNIFVF